MSYYIKYDIAHDLDTACHHLAATTATLLLQRRVTVQSCSDLPWRCSAETWRGLRGCQLRVKRRRAGTTLMRAGTRRNVTEVKDSSCLAGAPLQHRQPFHSGPHHRGRLHGAARMHAQPRQARRWPPGNWGSSLIHPAPPRREPLILFLVHSSP